MILNGYKSARKIWENDNRDLFEWNPSSYRTKNFYEQTRIIIHIRSEYRYK